MSRKQLTDTIESINDELDEIETQTSDIICVQQLWARYNKKMKVRQ